MCSYYMTIVAKRTHPSQLVPGTNDDRFHNRCLAPTVTYSRSVPGTNGDGDKSGDDVGHCARPSAPPNASIASLTRSSNIGRRAKRSEATGKKVRTSTRRSQYSLAFSRRPHLIEAGSRRCATATRLRAVARHRAAREAAAAFHGSGVNVSADRVLINVGHLRRHRARPDPASSTKAKKFWCPSRLSALHRGVAKIGAQPAFYRNDHTKQWQPDLDHLRSLIQRKTRALVSSIE